MREKLNKGLVSISYTQLQMKRIKHNIPHISRKREKGTNSLNHLNGFLAKEYHFCVYGEKDD